jgi:hypothetical protein
MISSCLIDYIIFPNTFDHLSALPHWRFDLPTSEYKVYKEYVLVGEK